MSTASWSTEGDQFQFPSPSPGYAENQALLPNGDNHDADKRLLLDLTTNCVETNEGASGEEITASESVLTRRFCPYSMRSRTLQNLPPPTRLTKSTALAQKKAIERQRRHIKRGPPCLDLLRKTLQVLFNVDVKRLLDKYKDEIIEPALRNMRENDESVHVDDEYPNMLIRQLLDDAKRMYAVTGSTTPFSASPEKPKDGARKNNNSPVKPTGLNICVSAENHLQSSSSVGSIVVRQTLNSGGFGRSFGNKRTIDSLSAAAASIPPTSANKKTKLRRHVDIDLSTEFVTGSMANTALGYSHARGRIYSKHPEVFRYMPDAEDKQWLLRNDIIKSLVGKVFLLRLSDVQNLVQSAEYRTQAGVSLRPLRPFTLSDFMVKKMMESSSSSDVSADADAVNAAGGADSKSSYIRAQSSTKDGSSTLQPGKSKLTGGLPLSPASNGGSSRRSDSDALGEDFVVRKAPKLRRQPNAVSDNEVGDIEDDALVIDEERLIIDETIGINGADELIRSEKNDFGLQPNGTSE